MQTSDASRPSRTRVVGRLVPFVHVADVEASLAFYTLLGFACDNRMKDERGRTFWASTASGGAEIMFAQADGPVIPEQQAVIFYMYCADVAALRLHLLASGVCDGGVFCGGPGPNNGRRVVFAVSHPHYMNDGELRVADPDGYCILVGQHEHP